MAFAVTDSARLFLLPTLNGQGTLTARQASLDAADRSLSSPIRAFTLGFDPARLQAAPRPPATGPPQQLPGGDSRRQATTSLCGIRVFKRPPPTNWAGRLG